MTASYRFGRFELRPATRQLLVDDHPAPLGARAFDVLLALIERRERLVTKEELLDLAWPGLVVEENNLQVQVSALRKILGNGVIATVAGRGYRFMAQVGDGALSHPTQPVERPPVADLAHKPSIAVLPFVNMSDDTANEYFADGLAEELLNVLSKIRGLHVASRTSAFSFKGAKVDIPTMAQKLNVATILEGSVRKAGNRVRISAQLIHVATDSHLWSATYDRELEDIFAVQDDIARSVVTELRAALMEEKPDAAATAAVEAEIQFAARGRGDNAEAYRLYLLANFHHDRFTAEDSAIAIEAYRAALKLDPSYALAWAGLAIAYATCRRKRLARDRPRRRLPSRPRSRRGGDATRSRHFRGPRSDGRDSSLKRFRLEGRGGILRPGAGARAGQCSGHARYGGPAARTGPQRRGDRAHATGYGTRPAFLVGLSRTRKVHLAAGRLDEAEAAIRKSLELSPSRGVLIPA